MGAWEDGFAAGYRKGLEDIRPLPSSRRGQQIERSTGRSRAKQGASRKKSAWDRYIAKKSNQIKFKSGKKKGLLNMKSMGVKYRKQQRKRKR